MGEDGEKYTFRTGDDLSKEELQEAADDLDISLAEILRSQAENILELHQSDEVEASALEVMDSHTENMLEDEDYRDLHEAFYTDSRDFQEFVAEEEAFDTKWVDETSVDYEEMWDNFKEVVYEAQKEDYEKAEDIIDSLKFQDYEQEAFLLNSVVSEYRR